MYNNYGDVNFFEYGRMAEIQNDGTGTGGHTMKQTYTSKETSINSKKTPAIYGMKKAIAAMTGKKVIDIGGGRFDTAAETARSYAATVSIYDPYNRSEEHNREVIAGAYDVAIISNVLNVIDSTAARADVVQLAGSKADTVLITVYEGDRSGTGRQTAADSWQENRATADYIKEIAAALPGWAVSRFGKLIKIENIR